MQGPGSGFGNSPRQGGESEGRFFGGSSCGIFYIARAFEIFVWCPPKNSLVVFAKRALLGGLASRTMRRSRTFRDCAMIAQFQVPDHTLSCPRNSLKIGVFRREDLSLNPTSVNINGYQDAQIPVQ